MTTYAGRPVFAPYFENPAGRPEPSVLITVYDRGTTDLVALYTDRTKATELDNPFSADSYGNAEFYADPGDYDALVGGVTLPFSVLPDPAEPLNLADESLPIVKVSGLAGALDARALVTDLGGVPNDRIRYVSPNGLDSLDGLSEGRPFRTLTAAIADLKSQGGAAGYVGGIQLAWGNYVETPTAYAELGGGTAAVQVTGRIPMGLVIQGKGPGSAILNSANCTDVLRVNNASRTTLRDLSVNPQGTVTNAVHITASGSTENTYLESVWVQGTANVLNCFAVGNDSGLDVSETLMVNCVQNGGVNGWKVGNSANVGNVGNVRCLGCVSQGNSNAGLVAAGGGFEWINGTCSNNDGFGDFYISHPSHSWPISIVGNRSEESFRFLTCTAANTGIPSINIQDSSCSNFHDPDKYAIRNQGSPGLRLNGFTARHISGSGSLIYSQYLAPMAFDVWTDNAGNPFTGVQPSVRLHCGTFDESANHGAHLTPSINNALKLLTVATGSRPTPATAGAGAQMYDTTISKPIWSDGTDWRDSAGTVV